MFLINKSLSVIIIFLFGFAGGLSAFYIFYQNHPPKIQEQNQETTREIRQGGYQFINPLLECESDSGLESKNLQNFKSQVQKIVDQKLRDKIASHISVYFRDLNNGPWFGIKEDENFDPASLLKVPVMITYLKEAENDPAILEKKLIFTPEGNNLPKSSDGGDPLVPGKSYTVLELIERMIVFSDNDAFYLLTFNMDYEKVKKVHADLGLILPEENTPENFISVKAYASLFRVLYNASYLNRQMSEQALSILSMAVFKDGLLAGLPADTRASHKYGIREQGSQIKQLHDCGVIYRPQHPYLLCVMTRGENVDKLASIIRDISGVVYQQINNN